VLDGDRGDIDAGGTGIVEGHAGYEDKPC